jgi:hypothetical protein
MLSVRPRRGSERNVQIARVLGEEEDAAAADDDDADGSEAVDLLLEPPRSDRGDGVRCAASSEKESSSSPSRVAPILQRTVGRQRVNGRSVAGSLCRTGRGQATS